MKKVLGKTFFEKTTLEVAQNLLGKYLIKKSGDKEVALVVNEIEVYDGVKDLASHASRGRTKRTEAMFGEAGRFYIYLVYGIYNMLNIVTDKKGYPAAILIRGAGELKGPGKLTKYLKIDKSLNNKKAVKNSGLWFEDRGVKIKKNQIKRAPRIGVSYAGPVWSRKLYRFMLK